MSDSGGGPEAVARRWARGGEDGLPRAVAPFSQGVRVGSLIFTAGQASIDADANVVAEGDIREQTAQTLRNVSLVLEHYGASLRDVVKMTIWLRDFNDYAAMNEVYAEWFEPPEPVRACVRSELVFPTLLVEMEAVAVVGPA
jgi:2-iminobutanoate/2-iminopropanoate deaminase